MRKEYSDSTLNSWTKKELIKYIRLLEFNYDEQIECNIQQSKNIEEILRKIK